MSYAEDFIRLRDKAGMTGSAVARAAGVSRAMARDLAKGHRMPSEGLHLELEKLFGERFKGPRYYKALSAFGHLEKWDPEFCKELFEALGFSFGDFWKPGCIDDAYSTGSPQDFVSSLETAALDMVRRVAVKPSKEMVRRLGW